MEGAGFALRHNFQLMRESGVNMSCPWCLARGVLTTLFGGKSLADILGIECVYAESSKGAPVGNAIAAGVGVGIFKDYNVVRQWVRLGARSIPNSQNHERYMKIYDIFHDLYPALKDQFVRLAEAIS